MASSEAGLQGHSRVAFVATSNSRVERRLSDQSPNSSIA